MFTLAAWLLAGRPFDVAILGAPFLASTLPPSYVRHRQAFLARRRHPDRYLCARVEAEFVHDVADVGGYRPLGDEQARTDLLVAEPLGDQAPDLDFPLCEWSGDKGVRRLGADAIGFAERELQRRF